MHNEHTPGPWQAEHCHAGAKANDDELGGLGWDVVGPPEPALRGMFARAADAHLIAAAPDLLAACMAMDQELMFLAAQGRAREKPSLEVIHQLRAAIAKAKGGAP